MTDADMSDGATRHAGLLGEETVAPVKGRVASHGGVCVNPDVRSD